MHDSSQDSDRASSSLVTAHQPGGGFRFGGQQRDGEGGAVGDGGSEEVPLTPALDTQPVGGVRNGRSSPILTNGE